MWESLYSSGENFLQLFKILLLPFIPFKLLYLLDPFKRDIQGGVRWYERPVIAGESQERSHFLAHLRHGPLFDLLYILWHHRNALLTDPVSQILHLRLDQLSFS